MTSVTLSLTKKYVALTDTTAKIIEAAATVYAPLTTYEFNGSDMTGADGDTGRTYTNSTTISTFAKVYLGSVGGGMMRLDSTKWSSTGAVLTIDVPVYDGDRVNIDQ